jgi:hypothetical protein
MRSVFLKLFPKKNYDACIAALAGFAIIWIYTRHSGIGISPDSVTYLSVARNLRAHGELLDYTESPVIIFPAFYPIFLSIFEWIPGMDPMDFAPVLNAFLFAMVIYTSGWIMESFVFRSKWYKQIILSCIVLSPGLLEIYSMMWSETLFILFLLFFIIALRHYVNSYSITSLLILSVITALSCITRYAGVTLIGTAGLLLLFDKKLDLKKKIFHIASFGLISGSLLAGNLLRNASVGGSFTGFREESLTSLSSNLFYCGNVFCEWLPIPKDHFVLAICVTALFILGFSLLVWRNINNGSVSGFEHIVVIFFLVYLLFIIVSATFSRYELINSRLLSPLFIPMLWGASSWLIPLGQKIWTANRLTAVLFLMLLTAAFQRNQLKEDHENYDGIKDAGIPGYTEDSWKQDSEIVNFIKKNEGMFKKGYTIYSNTNDAFYFFTGQSSELLPHRIIPEELTEFYQKPDCYLIWFDDSDNDELITLQDALAHKKMSLVYQFSNGAIYITAP